MSDHDRFHATDSVNANDASVRQHSKLILACGPDARENPANASPLSGIAAQHDQYAAAALERLGGSGERRTAATGDNEISKRLLITLTILHRSLRTSRRRWLPRRGSKNSERIQGAD
jgi:hypothetical protein